MILTKLLTVKILWYQTLKRIYETDVKHSKINNFQKNKLNIEKDTKMPASKNNEISVSKNVPCSCNEQDWHATFGKPSDIDKQQLNIKCNTWSTIKRSLSSLINITRSIRAPRDYNQYFPV